MQTKIFLLLGVLFLYGCSSPERDLRRMERQMKEQLPLLFADDILPVVFTPGRLDSAAVTCASFREKMNQLHKMQIKPEAIAVLDRTERFLSKHEAIVQNLSTDPAQYNIGGYLKTTLAQTRSTLEQRLKTIHNQMARAATYYASARQNLTRPDPAQTRLAVQKHLLALEFMQMELRDSIAASKLPTAQKEALSDAVDKTRIEVKDYLAFCQSILFESRDSTLRKE